MNLPSANSLDYRLYPSRGAGLSASLTGHAPSQSPFIDVIQIFSISPKTVGHLSATKALRFPLNPVAFPW
jgi:hypothetical protein